MTIGMNEFEEDKMGMLALGAFCNSFGYSVREAVKSAEEIKEAFAFESG